jgi:3-phosphoshikimate 1-carboxyvinyltransferase
MSRTPYLVRPLDAPPDADVPVPGSKSLTNRARVAALLGDGTSTLTNVLVADDTEAMLAAVALLGARVRRDGTTVLVDGHGGRVADGPLTLDARQAGTTARFLPPVLALGRGRYHVDADAAMRARPMAPLVDALRSLGVDVDEDGEPGHLPITVVGRGGVDVVDPVPLRGDVSSQFLSGLLLAAPCYEHGLRVSLTTPLVSAPYVDMTLSVMDAFGIDGASVEHVPAQRYRATTFAVEPDATAASYFLAAAAMTDGGRVRVPGLGRDSVQGDVVFADVLRVMGADVTLDGEFIEVRGTGELHGVEVDMSEISDCAQTLAAIAPFADTVTRITGIGFIRRKETDRVGNVVTELRRCGAVAIEEEDGIVIEPSAPALHGARVRTYGDHRMAMAFALIGLRVDGIEIDDPSCVAKTFPRFWEALDRLRLPRVPDGTG